MASELKKSVVRGMAWSAVEKIGTMLLQAGVSLILAWYLIPEDIALIGILLVFVSVASVFVDSGFSAALIRRKEITREDYTSVFAFNIVVAVVLYLLLLAITPFLASYYDMPAIRNIAPVLFLIIPFNSAGIIQSTILARCMDFKSYTKFTLWANLAASAVAVTMAFGGLGIWAVVGQRLSMPLVRVILMWVRSDWRPTRKVSIAPLRSMFGYSSRLLASDLANSIYSNISQLFIAKMYTSAQLGYYEQARKLKDMPVTSMVNIMQGVTFPAMSKLQDDPAKLSHTGHQVIEVMNFLVYPVMIGLIAVAGDAFAVLLPERWMQTVPYFQILCVSGLFAPLSVISYNILKTKSDGKLIFRLEIVKKIIATIILAATIPIGVMAIVIGQTAIFFTDAVINSMGAGRYVKWSFSDRLKEVIPYLLLSAAMWCAVYFTGVLLYERVALHWVLIAKITAGALVYFGLAKLFRPEGLREIRLILRRQ